MQYRSTCDWQPLLVVTSQTATLQGFEVVLPLNGHVFGFWNKIQARSLGCSSQYESTEILQRRDPGTAQDVATHGLLGIEALKGQAEIWFMMDRSMRTNMFQLKNMNG